MSIPILNDFSASSFALGQNNATFYGLVILALLGIEVPLNMGVEIKDRRAITSYLFWGSIVVMGVSGAGKSTVGALLATRLGYEFLEGDRLHPTHNIERMASGHPLTDAERLGERKSDCGWPSTPGSFQRRSAPHHLIISGKWFTSRTSCSSAAWRRIVCGV